MMGIAPWLQQVAGMALYLYDSFLKERHSSNASRATLIRRTRYGGRKGKSAARRLGARLIRVSKADSELDHCVQCGQLYPVNDHILCEKGGTCHQPNHWSDPQSLG